MNALLQESHRDSVFVRHYRGAPSYPKSRIDQAHLPPQAPSDGWTDLPFPDRSRNSWDERCLDRPPVPHEGPSRRIAICALSRTVRLSLLLCGSGWRRPRALSTDRIASIRRHVHFIPASRQRISQRQKVHSSSPSCVSTTDATVDDIDARPANRLEC